MRSRARKVRHRGGWSYFTERENPWGEWALLVEPEHLQIDAAHRGRPPHVHDPANESVRHEIPGLTAATARSVVTRHLRERGRILFGALLEELRGT